MSITNITNNNGYFLSAGGTNEVKLEDFTIENNTSTTEGTVLLVNGATLTLSGADSVIRNNKGVNGSVLRMNSGKL